MFSLMLNLETIHSILPSKNPTIISTNLKYKTFLIEYDGYKNIIQTLIKSKEEIINIFNDIFGIEINVNEIGMYTLSDINKTLHILNNLNELNDLVIVETLEYISKNNKFLKDSKFDEINKKQKEKEKEKENEQINKLFNNKNSELIDVEKYNQDIVPINVTTSNYTNIFDIDNISKKKIIKNNKYIYIFNDLKIISNKLCDKINIFDINKHLGITFVDVEETINIQKLLKILSNIIYDKTDDLNNIIKTIKIFNKKDMTNTTTLKSLVSYYIQENYTINNNEKDKITFSQLNNEIEKYYRYYMLSNNLEIKEKPNNTNISLYLRSLGLNKKRTSEGICYYGLVKKINDYNKIVTKESVEELIKSRQEMIDKIFVK